MQSTSTLLLDTLEKEVSLEVYARVVAEWELNSYYEVSVTGSDSTSEELFPMDSVALPRRPVRRGLPKLIVNQGRLTLDNTQPKYRIPGEDSNYKYYHSEATTNSFNAFSPAVELEVLYDTPAPCNKFVAGFETSFSSPTTTEILVTYNGTDWVTTGVHNIDSDGVVNLWLQFDDSWGEMSTLYEDNYVEVRGWKAIVSEMDRPDVGVSIIQLSPRLAMDLTNRVIDTSTSKQREQYDISNPIGTAAAATAEISFANEDRFFDQENPASPINNLIDRNVRFDVSDVVVRPDGNAEAVAQGSFFADDWSVDSEGQAGVSATDRSKFLQESIVENSFYWNKTAEHIVRDILDRFGHPSYDIRYAASDANRRIPYVFFKDEETVWDALQSLALAEQASFYFDEQDVFVWESRDYVWQNSTADWTLRNEADGTLLPNLISWSPSFELAANKVNIKYTPLAPATSGGQVINNVVWEQSDTLVLNASALTQDMTSSSTTLRIVPEDYEFWPQEGIMNLDGEYMRYEKGETDGQFDITERGLFGSTPKAHNRNPENNNWFFRTTRRVNSTTMQNINSNSSYGRHLLRNSYVELSTPGKPRHHLDTAHYFVGTTADSYAYYGAEAVFPVSKDQLGAPIYDGDGTAGLFLHNNGSGDGYYFELMTTQFAVGSATRRAEARVWRRNGAGRVFLGTETEASKSLYPSNGRQFDILPGERYRIEVLYRRISDQNHFNFFINGQSVMSFIDTASGTKRTSGLWGVYCRDKTHIRFDSAWAVATPLGDNDVLTLYSSLRDRVTGGFNSGLLESMWSKMNRAQADVVFEDFGPIVHGGAEYDVDYEIAPNVATDLFVSNDEESFIVFHDRDPFSSKFAIVNKAREDAVIVGSDPSRDNQNMSLFVYGRPIVEQDERSISRQDTLSLRRRGLEELEISSTWVQTKQRAERIADWIIDRWGKSNDIVEVEMILAPHLQVGDLIEVNAPSENLYPATHKYNIVAISKSVGSAHSMSVTLRRRR